LFGRIAKNPLHFVADVKDLQLVAFAFPQAEDHAGKVVDQGRELALAFGDLLLGHFLFSDVDDKALVEPDTVRLGDASASFEDPPGLTGFGDDSISVFVGLPGRKNLVSSA